MGPSASSGCRGRGNATHSIDNSVRHGLKGDTGAGNDSDKENNDVTVGPGEKSGLPHTNIFFQQDVARDE